VGLLTPLFLVGLGALAVPFIVHLVQRDRRVVVEFPSLMFLRRIPFQATRRHKLRRLLLLALRCLALIIIVAAFARPFLEKQRGAARLAAGAAGGREIVLLIDRSYSMAYGDRWQRAIAGARELIGEVSAGDRISVVGFASRAVQLGQSTSRPGDAERVIATLAPLDEATKFAPAFRVARQLIESSDRASATVVLISDFQRSGWSGGEEIALPAGTELRPVDVSGTASADLAVVSVESERRGVGDVANAEISARVVNSGDEARTASVQLDVAGRPMQTVTVAVPARGSAQARFRPVRVPQRAVRGTVKLSPDALPRNDARHFVVAPDEDTRALVIETPGARGSQSLYISRALALAGTPRVEVTVRTAGAVTAADIEGRTLFVFNEAGPPSGALGRRMRDIIERGGGALLVPGERGLDLPVEWRPLLPASIGSVMDREASAGAVAFIDRAHPAFELFRDGRSGDFTAARVLRERVLEPRSDATVIARFDDGLPALVERQHGRGRILVWGTTLDAHWTDLPLQPVFLPFAHRLALYAARERTGTGQLHVGEALDVAGLPEFTPDGEFVLESPSGDLTRLSTERGITVAELPEQGFYELRRPEASVG
jgi:Mg-chelatase subunit ChlD/uncharacterized membrane protein